MRANKSSPSTQTACAVSCGVFRRIMVAIDESEQARYAVDLAARLAREMKASLTLVHVAHVPPPTNPDLAYNSIELRAACLEGGQRLLDRVTAKLTPSMEVETVLRDGDPATEIVDAATRLGADLIVIGTHGRGRLAEAVVGSVAGTVKRKASCPVLVVAHPVLERRLADQPCDDANVAHAGA